MTLVCLLHWSGRLRAELVHELILIREDFVELLGQVGTTFHRLDLVKRPRCAPKAWRFSCRFRPPKA
jgi:hypothetical protein